MRFWLSARDPPNFQDPSDASQRTEQEAGKGRRACGMSHRGRRERQHAKAPPPSIPRIRAQRRHVQGLQRVAAIIPIRPRLIVINGKTPMADRSGFTKVFSIPGDTFCGSSPTCRGITSSGPERYRKGHQACAQNQCSGNAQRLRSGQGTVGSIARHQANLLCLGGSVLKGSILRHS